MTDDYRIVADEKDIRVELHVLARAYQDACVALTKRPPEGRHYLVNLDVSFDFGAQDDAG